MTSFAWVMLTVQVPMPVQAPLQPPKVLIESAVALSITLVPLANWVLQDALQLRPAGLLTTVPEPVPDLVTLSV